MKETLLISPKNLNTEHDTKYCLIGQGIFTVRGKSNGSKKLLAEPIRVQCEIDYKGHVYCEMIAKKVKYVIPNLHNLFISTYGLNLGYFQDGIIFMGKLEEDFDLKIEDSHTATHFVKGNIGLQEKVREVSFIATFCRKGEGLTMNGTIPICQKNNGQLPQDITHDKTLSSVSLDLYATFPIRL